MALLEEIAKEVTGIAEEVTAGAEYPLEPKIE